ncbi:MAG: Small-conductance mechanosensitive ion channel-like protein [Parcubacteria group bacterium GW2011_GWA2_40_14]|nr:MAG: Small-conductance mechanosensitive ion channel-like protein [Parcubacteria group bacterium GW2011_GWA2_40_14]
MFIPNLIVAIVILLIGWAIGAVVCSAIVKFMDMIKFDEALRKAGLGELVRKAGLNLHSGRFIGKIAEYFIVIAFLVASFDVLGLSQVTVFLQQIVLGYLPQLIIAVLILLIGSIVGDVMSRIVIASSRTAGLTSAHLLGTVTKWGIWVFAILIALSQMGIGGVFIQTIFTGFVVAVSLALGLSFGLGGQAAASRTIEKIHGEISHH